jgi:hypothetical protein
LRIPGPKNKYFGIQCHGRADAIEGSVVIAPLDDPKAAKCLSPSGEIE